MTETSIRVTLPAAEMAVNLHPETAALVAIGILERLDPAHLAAVRDRLEALLTNVPADLWPPSPN
jgi:hypothetical protein